MVTSTVFTLLLIASAACAHQVPLDDHRGTGSSLPLLDPEFEAWLTSLRSEWGSKGLSIAVVQKDQDGGWHVETKGYGILDAAGSNVTSDSLFAIGSNSKLFAGLALGALVNDPDVALDWDTKVSSLLPEWKLQDPIASNNANLLDILSHRTGLQSHDLSYRPGQKVVDVVSKLRYLKPSAEFRAAFQYNNPMYMTASLIVERLSGLPFIQFVQDRIITPLGLHATTYNETAAELTGHLGQGFAMTALNASHGGEGWTQSIHQATPFWLAPSSRELIASAGGVLTSAKDVAIWLQFLLLEGRHPTTNKQIFPAAAIRQVATGVSVALGRAPSPERSVLVYGAGQLMYSYRGHEIIEHNGGTTGWLSVITRLPSDGVGIAVLTNWDQGGTVMEIIKYRLMDKALGLNAVDWNARYRARTQAEMDAIRNGPSRHPGDPPTLPISQLAGVYAHPVYGVMDLCDTVPSNSSSFACTTLLDNIASGDIPLAFDNSIPTFVMHVGAIFGTHLVAQHLKGNTFSVSIHTVVPRSDSVPEAFSTVKTPASAGYVMEFVVVDTDGDSMPSVKGFGWSGGFSRSEVPAKGEGVEERAEVWVERVHA